MTWWLQAACRDAADANFATGTTEQQHAFIGRYCGDCPVVDACLADGVGHPGVYGGKTAQQRAERPDVSGPRSAQCGTRSGYRRHQALGEETCGPCRAAEAARQRRLWAARRATQRLPAQDTGACGTGAGYQRHHARGEEACAECVAAKTEKEREYRAARAG